MDSATDIQPLLDAPLPRQDGPITEDEVLEWSERLEAALRGDEELVSLPEDRGKANRVVIFDRSVADTLERSVELLLQKHFREEFSDMLFGESRLCGRGFVLDDDSHGGSFLRRWRVLGVVPPVWDDRRRSDPNAPAPRHALLAPFHLPILRAPLGSDSSEPRSIPDALLRTPSLCAPRPPAPIAEPEAQSWAENIRAEIHAAVSGGTRWSSPNPRLSTDQWFFSIEQSIELMLDPVFRRDFTSVLYGKTETHDYGYGPDDPECRRFLARRWGIVDVSYPEWVGSSGRYLLFTALTVPWTNWAPRHRVAQGKRFNTRLQLIHRDELNYHPRYLLTCGECGSPQGALVPLDSVEETGATPREQVAAYLARRGRPSWRSRRHLRQLAEQFSEEILGFGASHHYPRTAGSFNRAPESGPISEILDWAMGFYEGSEFPSWQWLGEVMTKERRRTRRTLQLLAGLLGRLECQVCRAVGALRYYPTFSYPIGADLDPTTQARDVKWLAELLRSSRERVAANHLFGRLFVFAEDVPQQRFLAILKRSELRHEDSIRRRAERPANLWLIAMWLADSLNDWPAFCERLGFGPGWRSLSPSDTDLNDHYRQLTNLHDRLTRLHEASKSSLATVAEARVLLKAREYGAVADNLIKRYGQEKLDHDLSQYRFRARDPRRTQGKRPGRR